MFPQFPISELIARRKTELGISFGEVVRRAGYKNISSGLRRLDDLCHGDLSDKTRFLVDGLPSALDLPPDHVRQAIEDTAAQLAEIEKAKIEAEERRYRERFRPHVIWATERDRPTSITMVAFIGVETLLKFDPDLDQGEDTFVAQAIAAMPSDVSFFGKVVGFYINFSPDRCVQYDRKGHVVATFPKSIQPGWADVTLKGDRRSILPLFGLVSTERRASR